MKIIGWIKRSVASSKYFDVKSRKCLKEVRKVIKVLENEGYGEYKWHYRSLEQIGLLEPKLLVEEFLKIQHKISRRPLRERELITGIVGIAISKSINCENKTIKKVKEKISRCFGFNI